MTDERAPLTADELAAELYRRQGYLVIASEEECPLGSIHIDVHSYGQGYNNTPLRITSISSRQEWDLQELLADEILGRVDPRIDVRAYFYFYCVEAVD